MRGRSRTRACGWRGALAPIACLAVLLPVGAALAETDGSAAADAGARDVAPAGPPGAAPPGTVPPEAAPAEAPRADPRSAPWWTTIRPILLLSLGAHDGGELAFGVDLGLRVAPVAARFAYRVDLVSDSYVEYRSWRLDWIFYEREWLAAYGGAGVGRLTYEYEVEPFGSASVTAYSVETGVLLGARSLLGPLLTAGVEILAPLARDPDPRNASLSAPRVTLLVGLNLAYLGAAGMHW